MLEVLRHGPLARAELARRLGLSPPSLTRLTAPLIEAGLLTETSARRPVGAGRPSRPLDVVPEACHFVGVKLTEDESYCVLTNLRAEPFTADSLRVSATNGIVLVLDVPRIADPPRTFDQMKLTAKRLAHNLGGELVDDNARALDDAALASIRKQVEAAAQALRESGIEPGSPRALALFGA